MIPRRPITVLGRIPYMPNLFPVAISINSIIQNNATKLAINITRFLIFISIYFHIAIFETGVFLLFKGSSPFAILLMFSATPLTIPCMDTSVDPDI